MAIFQVMKAGVPTGDLVDDGRVELPGEEGFTVAEALKLAKKVGGDAVNYVGESPEV